MTEAVKYRRERLDRGIKARSDTIYALSSWREMSYLILPRVLPVVLMLLLPLIIGDGYWGRVLFIVCTFGFLALSWDLLASVGLVSIGQSFFFAAGGYAAASLNQYLGLSLALSIILGTILAALVCTLFFIPVVRLKGIYFSMISLLFPMLLSRVIEVTKWMGGTDGFRGITPFPNYWIAIYLAIPVLIICMFFLRRIINEDYGLVILGIRDNDRAVMSSGINIYWHKIQVVFIGSLIAAYAGALTAHSLQFVGMSYLALDYSVLPLACVILGGQGAFVGAVLGAFILVPLSEALRALGGLRVVLYSVVLIAVVVGLPEGIFHWVERRYHQFQRLVKV